MKLSLKVIAEQLSAAGADVISQSNIEEMVTYDFPRLYQAGEDFQSGVLYVADAGELPKGIWMREKVGMIVRGAVPEAYPSQGCAVLCIDPQISVGELFAAAASVFWRFNQWETDMRRLQLSHPVIQRYLEQFYPMVGEPIWVTGKVGNIMGHLEADEDGVMDSSTDFDGVVAPLEEIYQNININLDGNDLQKVLEVTAQAKGKSWHCLFHKMFSAQGDYLGGLLLVGKDRQITFTDKMLVSFLAEVLSESFERMIDISGRKLWEGSPILKDILAGATFSQADLDQRAKAAGLSGHRFCCIRMVSDRDSRALPIDNICWHINSDIENAHALFYDSSIVVFLCLPDDEYHVDELPAGLMEIMRRVGFCAGVSHTFSDLQEAPHYYYQACKALELGAAESAESVKKVCYFFADYALQCVLHQSSEMRPARTLCMEGVKQLQNMDRDNGSDYCNTLRLYFKNGQNLQKTANELFIHRSTLVYRLNRIKNDAKIDIDDYQSRLYAMLSLELLEI